MASTLQTQKDFLSKVLQTIIVISLGAFGTFFWFAWQKLDSIENQVTALVATQPFILSNIDDANKKIQEHVQANENNDRRQDDEITELRRIVAVLPNRVKLKHN